jgi:hypothetical protein
MSLSHYFPFIAAFATTIGIGFFGTVVYAQNGGLVSDVSKPVRQGTTVIEYLENAPIASVEQLPLELDEVVIKSPKMHKGWTARKHKKVWHCQPHELAQGGLSDAPTVDVCEWVPYNP